MENFDEDFNELFESYQIMPCAIEKMKELIEKYTSEFVFDYINFTKKVFIEDACLLEDELKENYLCSDNKISFDPYGFGSYFSNVDELLDDEEILNILEKRDWIRVYVDYKMCQKWKMKKADKTLICKGSKWKNCPKGLKTHFSKFDLEK
jgi:hypothetical protein